MTKIITFADGYSSTTSPTLESISVEIQAALDLKANLTLVGANSGIASLDSTGKVPLAQIPPISAAAHEDTYSNLVTWALTADDAAFAFSTDTKLLYYVVTGILQEVAVMKTISGTVTSAQVSVGTSAVRAISTGSTPNANRKRLMITPLTIAGSIFIGGSTVSISNGKPIIGPDTIFLDWDASDYFLVSDVAGNVVSIVEVI